MSGKEASASNTASGSTSAPQGSLPSKNNQLGHRKTAKNRNSSKKRIAKKNMKMGKIAPATDPNPEEKIIDQEDSTAAGNTTAADDKKVDISEQPVNVENQPKDILEMPNANEEEVIPKTEVFKQSEDCKPITAAEDSLPTEEDFKESNDTKPDIEPTKVAETEEENTTANDLIEEKPKNIIDPTKVNLNLVNDAEPDGNASTAENSTAGKEAKKRKKRQRKALKNRKRALDLGASGLNKPVVQESGADKPNVSASGAIEPTVLTSGPNEPIITADGANKGTVFPSEVTEPTVAASEANEPTVSISGSQTEQPPRALSPRAMLLKPFEVVEDDEPDDFNPDDVSDENDWGGVQDDLSEFYE